MFIEQNVQNICLIQLGLLILSTSFSFSDNLPQGAYIIFQKMLIIFQNSVDNFEVAPNTYLICWGGFSYLNQKEVAYNTHFKGIALVAGR